LGVQLFQGSGKLALIAAATLALVLAGCGRKSGLDLPPQAAAQPAAAEGQPAQQQRNNPFGLFDPEQEDAPPPVAGQKRRIILDRILD
jgi:predicted small lipoprotein YifL